MKVIASRWVKAKLTTRTSWPTSWQLVVQKVGLWHTTPQLVVQLDGCWVHWANKLASLLGSGLTRAQHLDMSRCSDLVSRDVNETFMSEIETRRPKNCPRRDRDNLKQYLSSHNLDAIDHYHGCFINSYNTLVPGIWYRPNLKNIIVGLCAVCIIHESIIVNSIQSSCWSLDMKISPRSDTPHILYLV